MLCKQSKNLIQQNTMTSNIPTINKHIIKVNNNSFIKKLNKYLVHHPLECSRGCHEAKCHHSELECSIPASKSSLLLVSIVHGHLVVPIPQIKLTKDTCPIQTREQLINSWQRKNIIFRLLV